MPTGDFPPNGPIDKPKDTKPDMEAFRVKVFEYIKKLQEPDPDVKFMDPFRVEIQFLIDQRKERHADKVHTELGMIELMRVNVDELTEADFFMWGNANNYTKGLITKEDLDAYKLDTSSSGLVSRTSFCAATINIISPFWMIEEMEEMEKMKKWS